MRGLNLFGWRKKENARFRCAHGARGVVTADSGVVTGRSARSLLYGITPTDTATYLGVFAPLALASLVACYLPARRASRIDPMQALRQE
jgi:hypothetical protein